MGSLAQHGTSPVDKPQTASGMTHAPSPFTTWLITFLREELRPYPGRLLLASRYTLAATITMLVIITFRLPGAAVGGFYALLVPRDTLITTLRGGLSLLLAFGAGLAFVLLGAILFVNYPLTHFLWVVGSFFLAFYGLSVLSNYGAATAFAIVIVLSIPVWDQSLPQAALVAANLFTALSVAVAILATIAVEVTFSLFKSSNDLLDEIDKRLVVIQQLLQPNTSQADRDASKGKLDQLALAGVSKLRQTLVGEDLSQEEKDRLSAVVSLVDKLVDLLAAFEQDNALNTTEAARTQAMAAHLALLRQRLKHNNRTPITPLQRQAEGRPVLNLLEQTLSLLGTAVSADPGHLLEPDYVLPAAPTTFKADLLSNPEHLNFALRGCAASVLCYFIFNAVFWPGLSTSLFSVVVAALPSTGASRQKSLLRVTGALVGGGLLGIGSQVFILPLLDTISGFAFMFVGVTFLATWIITSSPRFSYFGAQMALAFYLIQLRGPSPQTNLALARDNLMGILLGLLIMWLVFEKLGSKPAVQVMRDLLANNLRLMADLARPWRGQPADLLRLRTLRATVSQNFAAFHSQADAVLFETGRMRHANLASRAQLLGREPRLVALFLVEVAWVHARLQLSTYRLPAEFLHAATHFDNEMCQLLEAMSVDLNGGAIVSSSAVQRAHANLKDQAALSYKSAPPAPVSYLLDIALQFIEAGESPGITAEQPSSEK